MTTEQNLLIRDVQIVTPNEVIDSGSVVVRGGRIVEVARTPLPPSEDGRTIDGHGLLLAPGLIDTHSDGLEKEISPRRTSHFPIDFALASFEARVRGAGVTTLCHGIGFNEKERTGRSVARAREMVDAILERNASPSVGVDHRLLYRTEARDEVAIDPLVADIDAGRTAGAERVLVSFEDHTPGQGQFRDVEQYRAAVDPSSLAEGQTVEEFVDQLMAEGEALRAVRDMNRDKLAPLALTERITLLAHDVDTVESVEAAIDMGATVAEFPVAKEAATAARDAGMAIVMGGPNALRGRSHSGNTSARELVAQGLCDVLASDYMPSTLLGSVSAMVDAGDASLVDAFRLVTAGPADMLGLPNRGRIAEGAVADLILVDRQGRWPVVVGVHRADDHAGRSALGA